MGHIKSQLSTWDGRLFLFLVCDNTCIHQGPRAQHLFNEAGFLLVYLPPYFTEINPIDLCFVRITCSRGMLHALVFLFLSVCWIIFFHLIHNMLCSNEILILLNSIPLLHLGCQMGTLIHIGSDSHPKPSL
ncbi:hypothetical protein VP01_3097g3 [Puccinia sorghi]|uniref:Tc1-like transposase DDE domain-containing protein n=1 Tax=Puccinia sorghi TaxID=27349 RepID=A0A0L6UZG6_9BASI|nr:hypothetical protein VP01_3097g3 [Puccinia sorghi]